MLTSPVPPLRVIGLDRPVALVGQVGVEVVVDAAVERREEVRLVDEVDAGLEVVAESAHAGHAPREVVAELPLRLLGLLRRVRDWRRSRRRWGRARSGSGLLSGIAFLKLANWITTSFSFAPPSTQLWFTLIELNVFSLVLQKLGALRSAAAYGCELLLRP